MNLSILNVLLSCTKQQTWRIFGMFLLYSCFSIPFLNICSCKRNVLDELCIFFFTICKNVCISFKVMRWWLFFFYSDGLQMIQTLYAFHLLSASSAACEEWKEMITYKEVQAIYYLFFVSPNFGAICLTSRTNFFWNRNSLSLSKLYIVLYVPAAQCQ